MPQTSGNGRPVADFPRYRRCILTDETSRRDAGPVKYGAGIPSAYVMQVSEFNK